MTAPPNSALETILRKDRLIVIGGLVAVIVVAWVYLLLGAGVGMSPIEMTSAPLPGQRSMAMGSSTMSGMMQPAVWSAAYALLILFMWWTMMVAMMLPSAAPTLLLFAAINRKQRERAAPYVPTGVSPLGTSWPGADSPCVQCSCSGGWSARVVVRTDGSDKHAARRGLVGRRGCLAVDAAKTRVFAPLSLPGALLDRALEARHRWRAHHGAAVMVFTVWDAVGFLWPCCSMAG